jgi:hypothetical protein
MSETQGIQLTALVQLQNRPEELAHLKRLALFFDHVSYKLPETPSVITETLFPPPGRKLEEVSFVRRHPDGSLDFSEFNYFRDCTKPFAFTLEKSNPQLQETISEFEDAGVMSRHIGSTDHFKSSGQAAELRDIIASIDAGDEEFNKVSQTDPSDYNVFRNIQYVTLRSASEPDRAPFTFAAIPDPNAVKDSRNLTEMFYAAHVEGLFPVFLNHRHREEIRYRYDQFLKGLDVLQKLHPELVSPAHFRGRYGEVAFSVANSVFSSDLIDAKSSTDILDYREAMRDSRRKYVSHDLMELSALVKENPWNNRTKEEVERYIAGKLNHDLCLLDDQSQRLWEKMFGRLTVQLAETSKSAGFGGGAMGLLGQVIPNATTWELIVVGAIAGVMKESPKLINTLTEFLVDFRDRRGNAISYLANFK